MIPDKIYIPLYPNLDTDGFHLGDDWMEKPDSYSKCKHVEYIRKDALLEWLRKTKDEALNEVPMLDVLTLQKVIDNLNSM